MPVSTHALCYVGRMAFGLVIDTVKRICKAWKKASLRFVRRNSKLLFSDCGQLFIANADVSAPSGTLYGSNATVTCHEGYIIEGPDFVECTEFGWNSTTSCVVIGKCSCLQSPYIASLLHSYRQNVLIKSWYAWLVLSEDFSLHIFLWLSSQSAVICPWTYVVCEVFNQLQ